MKVKMKTLQAGPNGTRQIGQIVVVENKEAEELVKGGFADYVDPPKKEPKQNEGDGADSELKKLPGGYYELPNGEKVRGKKNALEALEELQAADDDDQEPEGGVEDGAESDGSADAGASESHGREAEREG